MSHRAHVVLLRVTFDQLHAQSQLRARSILDVLFHGKALEDVLVIDCNWVDCIFIGQYNAGFGCFKRCPAHVLLIHAGASLEEFDQVLVLRVV